MFENDERISAIPIIFESTLNSIKVPPLKSIPKFKPLKKINIKLANTKNNELRLDILKFPTKL